jgi:hypothetical protein
MKTLDMRHATFINSETAHGYGANCGISPANEIIGQL